MLLSLNDKLSEVEIHVVVTFDVDFIPCDLREMNTQKALGVETLVAVYNVDLAVEFCGDPIELKNVAVGDKLYLIKVFAASFHSYLQTIHLCL